jgi:hypothetical protein
VFEGLGKQDGVGEVGEPCKRAVGSSSASPGDAEIRAALLKSLHQAHEADPGTTFLQELGLCKGLVRVDVAVVNGVLHGYEIKSDRDTLRSLSTQVALYGRVLDRATLVVGSRHAKMAAASVPEWWEILMIRFEEGTLAFDVARPGRCNPARDARALVELLWLEESLQLLDARGSSKGYRRRPRRQVWDRVCELYQLEEIADAVRCRLKARRALGLPARPA